LIDQLLISKDLAATMANISVRAFRPAGHFESRPEYKTHRDEATSAQVMICTSASVIIDQRLKGEYNGASKRDYLLFDEADQLPSAAALQSDREIPAQVIRDLGITEATADGIAATVLKKRYVEPEIRAVAKMICEATENPAWYQSTGMTDDGAAALLHKMPGRLLRRLANQGNTAFISATLSISGRFDDFKRSLGIDSVSSLSSIIEPEQHGELRFTVDESNAVDTEEWLEACKAIVFNAERPSLVITPSHSLAQELAIEGATIRQPDETTRDAAMRMPSDGVLVAAAAWAGLDLPTQWKSVVIPRVPFPKVTVLDEQIESSYLNSRNEAVRRMRQAIGRGLRSPDAECHVYILDPRVRYLPGFLPKRFSRSWEMRLREGGRETVVLSRAERSPYYRQLAIKIHGNKCQACGFTPRASRQIEVHHLQPLAEGERDTTIEDLAVLCANCHALAHSESPPIPLDRLRKLAEVNS
jgi:Rad3-related DNA helicase